MGIHLTLLTAGEFHSCNFSPPAERLDSRLLALSNELLHEVFLMLGTSDLRRVSLINHELHSYVTDFLARYRYHVGIFRLPKKLLLRVTQHLKQRDRCRLAQASQKLHPAVMDLVIRHNIRRNGSSILNHAAKNNLEHLARKLIRLGGNVDTVHDISISPIPRVLMWHYVEGYLLMRPLMSAALHGHERIVSLLLLAGAGQHVYGITAPLTLAMLQRNKRLCEILLPKLPIEDMPAILKLASYDQYVKPVRWLLEAGESSASIRQARTVALYHILNEAASTSDFLMNEVREEGCRIVALLLKYEADSLHCEEENKFKRPLTARQLASRHPDPRVRKLIGAPMPMAVVQTEGTNVQIGRAM
jgi:hypothetical protein